MDFDATMAALEPYLPKQGNNKSILDFTLYMTTLFAFALFISACIVASTANAGFNIVFTSLLNLALAGGSLHVLRTSKSPIAVGFLIGSTMMMAIINLEAAVFWGQLSHCKPNSHHTAHYSCTNPAGYGAVSAFSSLLLICQTFFSYLLTSSRGEFIDETGVYDSVDRGQLHSAVPEAQSDYV